MSSGSGLTLLASLVAHLIDGPSPLDVGLVVRQADSLPALAEQWSSTFGRANFVVVTDGSSQMRLDAVVVDAGSPLAAAEITRNFRRLRPGGLLVLHPVGAELASKLAVLVDVLNRGCFDDDFVGPFPEVEHRVKAALFMHDLVALARHGAGDEVDYLTLGDYGRAYGEGRGQIISRLRLWEASLPPTREESAYFGAQLGLYRMRLAKVVATLTFRLRLKSKGGAADGEQVLVLTPRKRKKAGRSWTVGAFKEALRKDLAFALALHVQRIEVGEIRPSDKQHADVDIHFLPAGVVAVKDIDFAFHRKMAWRNWTSYFRHSEPQPLHVVAQTFREKALMVGDDLSDFYRGSVTVGALEKKWRVTVHSPHCSDYQAALKAHRFACQDDAAESMAAEEPVGHSRLYHLFAKEKLDCCIGEGAFGDLVERKIDRRGGAEPAALAQDGEFFLNGRRVARYSRGPVQGDWTASKKVTRKVEASLDRALGAGKQQQKALAAADDSDCSSWAWRVLWPRLRARGLYAFEQDGCYGGYENPVKHRAPDSSVTGWARSAAQSLANGSGHAEVELVVAHKNLIVVQKLGVAQHAADIPEQSAATSQDASSKETSEL